MMQRENQKEADVREEDFAAQVGISREALREVRSKVLSPGDWFKQSKEIFLRAAAVKKVLAALKIRREPSSSAPEDKTVLALPWSVQGPRSAPDREVLRVHALPKNRRLLMAINAAGTVIRVRVKDSSKFLRSMQIHARCIQGDLYEHVGRLPRYRGRY